MHLLHGHAATEHGGDGEVSTMAWITGRHHVTTTTSTTTTTTTTDLLHGHAATEHGGDGEVSTMAWVTGGHHVLSIKHLLDQLRHGQRPVLLGTT